MQSLSFHNTVPNEIRGLFDYLNNKTNTKSLKNSTPLVTEVLELAKLGKFDAAINLKLNTISKKIANKLIKYPETPSGKFHWRFYVDLKEADLGQIYDFLQVNPNILKDNTTLVLKLLPFYYHQKKNQATIHKFCDHINTNNFDLEVNALEVFVFGEEDKDQDFEFLNTRIGNVKTLHLACVDKKLDKNVLDFLENTLTENVTFIGTIWTTKIANKRMGTMIQKLVNHFKCNIMETEKSLIATFNK